MHGTLRSEVHRDADSPISAQEARGEIEEWAFQKITMKDTPMFRSDGVFGLLRAIGTARKVAPGTVLFRQGDVAKEVVLVLSGDVALTPVATEPTLCRLAGPGTVLGLPANLSGKVYDLTAVAGDSCEVVFVARKQCLATIQQDS